MDKMKQSVTNAASTTEGHSDIRHLGMMLICCLVPLGSALTLKILGYAGVASYLVLLLCPLMHLVMMKDLFVKKDHCTVSNNNAKKDGLHG